ncbi:SpoIIE family protein phosphatase [Micromonospora sp. WMMD882]|uniref:ATP-binding SpoIIE family protein phosphatase n=1 Tax=Micromonospora sp. WMMD882 TaxID=3015151 RepID=UPI00248B9E4A|nr:SpoIIE family protein phosphatase [Micromonospora sp. WMMD882]WBB81477.1 SpoIIE family protein phosphatase [Micromonospora sp. WMMD882]
MPGTVGHVPASPAPVPGAPATGTAALVLGHPWAGTSLGAIEGWDPAVRAVVDLVLGAAVPMSLTLGAEFLLVYNDGYAELVGAAHPAIGQPAAEVFADVWPLPGVGDLIERTFHEGRSALAKELILPVTRYGSGAVEQGVFTRGCSPVRDSAGAVVGVLTVVAETTQGTEQLQSLSELAAALSGTLTLDDVARVALRYALDAFDADRVAFAVDDGGGWRIVRRVRGELLDEADERLPPLWRRSPDDRPTPLVTAARSGAPIFTGDGRPLADVAVDRHDQKIRALANLPLRSAVLRGGISVGYQRPHPWSAGERALLAAAAELVGQAAERARRFENQHGTAQLLQRSMLPEHLPDLPRLRIAARYDPGVDGNAAGGDFYDAFLLPDGRLGVVLGDVAGHDVQAAARMGQVRAALRALALTDPRPDAVLAGLDRLVASLGAEGGTHELFVTVVFGVIDAERELLTLASAGHPAPLLRRCADPDDRPAAAYLDVVSGAPLGLGCLPGTTTVPFTPGDTLLLFSDGVVERRWQSLSVGLAGLAEAVATAGSGDPRALCAVATAAVPGATDDDVAVLAVEHALMPSRSAGMEVPAEPTAPSRVRRWMTAQLSAWQVPESIVGAAVLCTSELTTNALLHAGTAARVEIDLSAERLLVSVADSGTRGAVTKTQTDTLSSRGRGLGLIEQLSDAWGTDPTVRGSTVWFEILIPPGR